MEERQKLKDDVYSDQAKILSRLSKDQNTKVGAIIVASDGSPVSWGYNGTVSGFNDSKIPHNREEKDLYYMEYEVGSNDGLIQNTLKSNKYPFMCHAESNALFYADRQKLVGATLYVTGFPCENCAREIARAKIKRVVIRSITDDPNSMLNQPSEISKYIFAQADIRLNVDGKEVFLNKC
jgi:dCMP deaminase